MNSQPSASGELREELRGDAENLTKSAQGRLHSELDARKGVAAEEAHKLSSALGAAADKLGPETPTVLRSMFERGAQTLQRFAETVEQKDSRQLTHDIEQLARQNPGTFLAACALAGFAAARVFKAGSSATTGSTGGSAYQGAYPSTTTASPASPAGYASSHDTLGSGNATIGSTPGSSGGGYSSYGSSNAATGTATPATGSDSASSYGSTGSGTSGSFGQPPFGSGGSL